MYVHDTKKAWALYLLHVPRIEAFALPFKSKRCNAEAHARRYVVIATKVPQRNGYNKGLCIYIHPSGHLPLLCL